MDMQKPAPSRKRMLWHAAVATVVALVAATLFLFGGFYLLGRCAFRVFEEDMDDFDRQSKRRLCEIGLSLDPSSEFVDGIYGYSFGGSDYRLVWRMPAEADPSSLYNELWQKKTDATSQTLPWSEEVGDIAFVKLAYNDGESNRHLTDATLYRSEVQDGYVYWYLTMSFD